MLARIELSSKNSKSEIFSVQFILLDTVIISTGSFVNKNQQFTYLIISCFTLWVSCWPVSCCFHASEDYDSDLLINCLQPLSDYPGNGPDQCGQCLPHFYFNGTHCQTGNTNNQYPLQLIAWKVA